MTKKAERFEDLEVWKEGMRISVETYALLKDCKDFGLKDQMQRASVSIPSNIAEGFERQTNKEFIQYLFIAKGSSGELRTQIYIAIQIGIIEKNTGLSLIERLKKLSSMIYNLILSRRNKV